MQNLPPLSKSIEAVEIHDDLSTITFLDRFIQVQTFIILAPHHSSRESRNHRFIIFTTKLQSERIKKIMKADGTFDDVPGIIYQLYTLLRRCFTHYCQTKQNQHSRKCRRPPQNFRKYIQK